MTEDGAREDRVRRKATRQGLLLVKSRDRDPHAQGYGLFVLAEDSAGNRLGRYGGQAAISDFASGNGEDLAAVEAYLDDIEQAETDVRRNLERGQSPAGFRSRGVPPVPAPEVHPRL